MQRRVVTTSQPQHPAGVDWSNPLARGLVLAVNGPAPQANLADGRPAITLGAQALMATPRGVGISSSGNVADRYEYAAPSLSTLTLFSLFRETSQATNGHFLGLFAVPGNSTDQLHMLANAGTPRAIGAYSASGTFQQAVDTVAVANNTYYAAAGTFGNFGRRLFKDGVLVASQATAVSPVGLNRFVLNSYYQANPASFVTPFNGDQPVALAWNRALSDAEIQSISANPWQIFLSRRPAPYMTATVAFDGKYRPSADITDGTWTRTPAGPDLYSAIDEPTPDDLDYISSTIAGSAPATMSIGPIPAGSQTLRIRAGTSSGTATLTVELLNDSNTVLGTQTQSIGSTTTTYNLTFSLASPATRVRIGVA